jgi:hypothetical protein
MDKYELEGATLFQRIVGMLVGTCVYGRKRESKGVKRERERQADRTRKGRDGGREGETGEDP